MEIDFTFQSDKVYPVEVKAEQNNVRLFILCSPHNPVGRVWTKSELSRITAICEKHSVIATSASKTFNLAGLQFSTNFIQNPVLRKKFQDERNKTGYDEPNIMGQVATEATYKNGKEWLTALKNHLQVNLDFLRSWLKANLPKVRLDRGTMFGLEGNNFQRINIATPRPILDEALERIRSALETLSN